MPSSKSWFLVAAFLPAYIYVVLYLFSASPSSVSNFVNLDTYSASLASIIKNLKNLVNVGSGGVGVAKVTTTASVKFIPRPSEERGHADHGWLKTFHTFSFADYQDNAHNDFGSLRVINEDRVSPNTGFGTHSHREFEIFSYIVSGELEHKDSMGNTEVLKRGDIQLTSAGTGISHSEKAHGDKQVHFLQIWSFPQTRGLLPKYFTRHFSDEEKKNKFARVVAPVGAEGVFANSREGSGPAPVQSPLTLFATLLSPANSLRHTFLTSDALKHNRRRGYIHVIQKSGYQPGNLNLSSVGAVVKIREGGVEGDAEGVVLREGDGVYVLGESGKELVVENVGEKVAEVLLFDLE